MTKYYNQKLDCSVEAQRIDPGSYSGNLNINPGFTKLFNEMSEPYSFVNAQGQTLVICDEMFQRFFVREPAVA